ncbi:MAG: hypothetical protein WCM76_00395 [Bacteroidota bacterium]
MKKFMTVLFVLSMNYCFAGTGSARDESLLILILITVLLFVVAILYSFDFFKRIIKARKKDIACDSETQIPE